ncbi:hypothetical protein JCM10450v2_002620 [Rhodotorula kratochvilovae]
MAAPAAPVPAPPQPANRLVSTSRVGGFDWTFHWDFDLKLDTPDLDESFDPVSPPWPGEWSVRWEDVSVSVGLFWGDEGREVRIAWDDYETGSTPGREATTGGVCNAWDVEFGMSMDKASPTVSEAKHAPAFHGESGSDASPVTNDVRLFFPRIGPLGAELWASARLLSSASPYFNEMLKSEFAENIKIGAKRPRTRASGSGRKEAADATTKDFDDSDDETDALLVKKHPPSFYDTDNLGEYSYRQITITKTAFSTYSAVLRFLETGFTCFAPLSSACTPVGRSAPPSRADRIAEVVKDEPDLLFPVSPKSAFRLAHLLELDRLKRMCLAELRKQLSLSTAPRELFDDASVCYEDWRKVVLEYIVENWDAVSTTSSWEEMTGRVDRDEVPGAAGILLAVMRARDAKVKA